MLVEDQHWGAFIQWIRQQKILAVDTETTGLRPFHESRIAGVSVGNSEIGFYASFGHGEGFNHPPSRLTELCAHLHHVPRIVMFNGTFDLNFLGLAGLPRRRPGSFEEVQVAAHLYNENDFSRYLGRKPGLKELADKYLGPGSSTPEDELQEMVIERYGKAQGRKKEWKGLMWNLPAAAVEEYAAADAVLTMRLRNFYVEYMRRTNMGALYKEICDYTIILQQMGFWGIAVDRQRTGELWEETRLAAEAAADEFRRLVGDPEFNLNSAPQLHALFNKSSVTKGLLKAWIDDWTKEQEDPNLEKYIDGKVIAYFEDNARLLPIAKALLNFRDAHKMHTSYFNRYLPLIDHTGRIHGNFNVIGTETGRISAWQPNLQAIPRNVKKHKVKTVFVPSREGGTLIEMDYEQAEMRLASFYGSEWQMADILGSGTDMHTATAELVGCDRDMAKRINFSAIYGIGARKFSATYSVPFEESRTHLNNYHAAYPGFRRLYNAMEQSAKERGALILPSGRMRHYYIGPGQIEEEEELARIQKVNMVLNHSTHKASSNLVQGMVAAVMMRAMARLDAEVPELPMVLTVHDSLIFDAPPELQGAELDDAIRRAKLIMQDPCPEDPAFRFYGMRSRPNCPMRVGVKLSKESWGEAEDWVDVET